MSRLQQTDPRWVALEDAIVQYKVNAHIYSSVTTGMVEAEVGNGSAILLTTSVIVSPNVANRLGGSVLVTVHRPWVSSYALDAGGGELYWDYLVEKFVPRDGVPKNMGDVYGVVRSVAEALYRPLVGVPERETDDD